MYEGRNSPETIVTRSLIIIRPMRAVCVFPFERSINVLRRKFQVQTELNTVAARNACCENVIQAEKKRKTKTEEVAEKEEKDDEDHRSRWWRWWWRGPLVGPSSAGALSGHSALLFSVFLFSLPSLSLLVPSFLPLSHSHPLRSAVRYTGILSLPSSSTAYQRHRILYRTPRLIASSCWLNVNRKQSTTF